MASTVAPLKADLLQTLPSDSARQIQWRFADRYDLQMLGAVRAIGGPWAGGTAGRERWPQFT